MADEKNALSNKVLTTEELFIEKNAFFEKQREEYLKNSLLLEAEKQETNRQLMANNKNLEQISEISVIESNKLKNEHEKLLAKILEMENEKKQLAITLDIKAKKSKTESEVLAKRLEVERHELSLNAAKMEKDKNDILLKIKEDEDLALLKSIEISKEMNEKLMLEKMKKIDIENEKKILHEKMKQSEDDEKQRYLDEQRQNQLELQSQIDIMVREKKELMEKLDNNEIQAKERQLSIEENLRKEKLELQLTVERMKNERKEEKRLEGLVNSNPVHSASFLKRENMIPRTISSIQVCFVNVLIYT